MHKEIIEKLEKVFEGRRRPYFHRILCAKESLNMDETDQVVHHLDGDSSVSFM